ncbi:hypothetical protein C2G38_2173797 [Gigaspora rosea]|uniref:Uncharacterized protein n=1 Tax=Gigaspora rosea TaxID=44941 RepID=A0A397VNE9_9GLOM|nr:hypothetical protein C2G38_2173797 [Gigaspora rosea]
MADAQETKLKYRRGTCFGYPPAAIAAPIVTNTSFLEIESYDLTIPEDEPNEFDERDEWEFTDNRNNEHNDDDDREYEYNYGIIIKLANGTTIPTKWYTTKVSTIDELLSELYINVKTLTKRRSIESSNYQVTFKPEKATGAASNLSPNESLIAKMF